MKSLAIFLILAFLTGFQAAVLNEEPPPSISEPNQSILEDLQEKIGHISNQVTESINGGLDRMKGRTTDALAYAADTGKKWYPTKLMTRKFQHIGRDIQLHAQTVYSQGRETMKDNYKKAMDALKEVKTHPAVVAVNEEMVQPLMINAYKFCNWIADQSVSSIGNMIQKKLSF